MADNRSSRNSFAQIQVQAQQLLQQQQMTPQQVLLMRLLSMDTLEIEERVRAEVQDNPALETSETEPEPERDDDSMGDDEGEDSLIDEAPLEDDYDEDDDTPDYLLHEDNGGTEESDYVLGDTTDFSDLLLEQLHMQPLTEQQMKIGEYLIGSLDDDGLLHKSLQSIDDDLAFYSGIDVPVSELEEVLSRIQSFDPAGIGARDLRECLLIQLQRMPASDTVLQARQVLEECYNEFTRRQWDRIADRLSLSRQQADETEELLVHLNPRPGSSLSESVGKGAQTIIPDFFVDVENDRVRVALDDRGIPDLSVSLEFTSQLREQEKGQSAAQREAARFLRTKINAANDFVSAMQMRATTMTSIMRCIAERQKAFFADGDETLLQPMILKDIAEQTGFDISTISRVSTSKYVQTRFGCYPLRFFFTDGVMRQDGEEVSVNAVLNLLQTLVDGEDKTTPLTDAELSEQLAAQGFTVARRTVAKYRDRLGIPVAALRHR